MEKKCLSIKHIVLIVLLPVFSFSQSKLNDFLTSNDTLNKPKRNAIIISEASIAGITLLGLNQLWYADYDRSKFHTTNDNN